MELVRSNALGGMLPHGRIFDSNKSYRSPDKKATIANAYEKITHHLAGYCRMYQRLRTGLWTTAGACRRLRSCGSRSALLHTWTLLPLRWCALRLGTWPLVSPTRATCLDPWGLRCSLASKVTLPRPHPGSATGTEAPSNPQGWRLLIRQQQNA